MDRSKKQRNPKARRLAALLRPITTRQAQLGAKHTVRVEEEAQDVHLLLERFRAPKVLAQLHKAKIAASAT
jgi:hypothetical protein